LSNYLRWVGRAVWLGTVLFVVGTIAAAMLDEMGFARNWLAIAFVHACLWPIYLSSEVFGWFTDIDQYNLMEEIVVQILGWAFVGLGVAALESRFASKPADSSSP